MQHHACGLPRTSVLRSSQNFSSRDCLESRRRVLDRLCVVLQEGEMGHFRPLLATRYTPNRGLLGLSRQSLEGKFSEVRSQKAEKASGHTSEVPPVALALELVVILVVRLRPGNGSPLRSQHITAARWVGRIEHHALQAHLIFLEVREIELTSRKRDAISYMTVRISKMRVSLEDLGHKTPGHEGAISLVLEAHLERQKPREGRRSRRSLPTFLLEIRSQPPPTTELLKRSKVGHPL